MPTQFIHYKERSQTIAEWAQELGLTYAQLRQRLRRLPTVHAAFNLSDRTARYAHDGQELTIAEWAERTGIKENTIRKRLERGYTFEEAISAERLDNGYTSRAKARRYIHGHLELSIPEWSKRTGLSKAVLYGRIVIHGWTVGQAIGEEPPPVRGKLLAYNGMSLLPADWAKRLGTTENAIHQRLSRGWSVERTLSQPFKRSDRGD